MSSKQLFIISTLLLCVSAHPHPLPPLPRDCEDCQRQFCTAVSEFLEGVTCADHSPCLSLDLQEQIAEKCPTWRPEGGAMRSSISKEEGEREGEASVVELSIEEGSWVRGGGEPPSAGRVEEEEEREWEDTDEGAWEWRAVAAAAVALGCVVWAAGALARWRRGRVMPYGKRHGGWCVERKI